MDHGMPENAIPHLCNAPVRGLPNCATEWVLCDKPLHMEWRQRKGLPSRVVGSNGEHRLRYLSRWTPRREDSLVASAIRLARANRPSVERMENGDVTGGAGGLPSVQCPLPVAAPSPAGTCPHGCVFNHPSLLCLVCESERRNGLIQGSAPVAAPAPTVTCLHGCVLDHPFLFCSLCEGERRN